MPRSHPGGRGRGRKGRKERGADYPLGPPASAPGALHPCKGPLVPRPGHPLQGAAGPAGRSPHTRGGAETQAVEPRASDHSPQRTEASSRTTTRGHISAPAAGSPQPPQASRAGAAADTERTRRHLLSQAGPAAQAAWPRARARSRRPPFRRPRGPRTRTRPPLRPASVAVDAAPSRLAASSSRSRLLPGGGARGASRSRPAAPGRLLSRQCPHTAPATRWRLSVCSPAHRGPHCICPCLLFPFTSLGTPCLISTGPLLRSRPASRFRNPLPRRCSEALPRSPLPSGPHSGSPLPSSNVLPRDGTSAAPHFSLLTISPRARPPAVGAHTAWGHLNASPAGSEPGGTTPRTGRRRSRVLWELALAVRGLPGPPGVHRVPSALVFPAALRSSVLFLA